MKEELFDIDLNSLANDVELKEEKKEEGIDKKVEEKDEKKEDELSLTEDELSQIENAEGAIKNTSSSSVYSTLAKALKEEGVFISDMSDDEYKKIESPKDFTSLFEKELKEARYLGLNNLQRQALDAMDNGIPIDLFVKSKSAEEYYNKIDEEKLEEDDDLKKSIIKSDFISRGFSEEEADEQISDIFDLGKEDEKAKTALEKLKKLESSRISQLKQANENSRQEFQEKQKKQLVELKDKVLKEDEIIKGFKVPAAMKEKIYNSMVNAVAEDVHGNSLNEISYERAKDPYNFELKLNYLWQMTNGFKDFSSLVQRTKTSALKALEEQMSSTKGLEGGQNGLSSTGKDLIKALKTANPLDKL